MNTAMTRTLEEMRERLTDGIQFDGVRMFGKRLKKGRFEKEFDIDVYLRKGGEEEHLLFLKGFDGWMPDYRPWVELFGIQSSVAIGKERIEFADSVIEAELLSLVAGFLGPGSHIFVEYYGDDETRLALEMSVPPAATRLGNELLKLDFTWFKDWYFPEGFLEGGQKLQAQKSLDKESRVRQFLRLREGLQNFREAHPHVQPDTLLSRSLVRAAGALELIEQHLV